MNAYHHNGATAIKAIDHGNSFKNNKDNVTTIIGHSVNNIFTHVLSKAITIP